MMWRRGEGMKNPYEKPLWGKIIKDDDMVLFEEEPIMCSEFVTDRQVWSCQIRNSSFVSRPA